MAKLSKFVKVDKNVLLEYIYDDDNNIGESYEVLVNSRERRQSYMASVTSGTNNTQNNSLFVLDKVANKFGKINTNQYSFLQVRNYSSSTPITHDKLVVHLPINWTFGEYLGFYVRVYTFDVLNQTTYDLSNYYFDMTDASQGYLLNFTSPPLLFSEKLWGKNLTIEFPAASAISAQRVNNRPKENSINANLTNGSGISLTSPVFIDFHFINNIQTINGISTYMLNPKLSVSVPQTPEFENLGLKIEHSKNGDFFEIYGTYNGTIAGFKQFIDDSFIAGSRYYVQYNITTFEQNVRGKTLTAEVIDNFNETIEFRPIIKSSTTTAIIDVEMRLIDAVNESTILRRASYGMLQDEVSRYSLNLIKINLKNANKPKIYNTKLARPIETAAIEDRIKSIKNKSKGLPPVTNKVQNLGNLQIQQDPTITGLISTTVKDYVTNAQFNTGDSSDLNKIIEKVVNEVTRNLSGGQVPVGVSTMPPQRTEISFYDRRNITVETNSSSGYEGQGQSQIVIDMIPNTVYPISFRIADKVENGNPVPKKLTGFNDIILVFSDGKAAEKIRQTKTTSAGGAAVFNLDEGLVYFEINDNSKEAIRKYYNNGNKSFHIVGESNGKEYPIYRGVFELSDSKNMQINNDLIIKAKMDAEKQKALAALNNTPPPQTIQDPSVNAPINNRTFINQITENIGNSPKKLN